MEVKDRDVVHSQGRRACNQQKQRGYQYRYLPLRKLETGLKFHNKASALQRGGDCIAVWVGAWAVGAARGKQCSRCCEREGYPHLAEVEIRASASGSKLNY